MSLELKLALGGQIQTTAREIVTAAVPKKNPHENRMTSQDLKKVDGTEVRRSVAQIRDLKVGKKDGPKKGPRDKSTVTYLHRATPSPGPNTI